MTNSALALSYYLTIGLVYASFRLSIMQAKLRRKGMSPRPNGMKRAVALMVIGWPIAMALWAYVKINRIIR